MKITPVIMAGGSGTRLWPLSRENYPKQFIKIFDQKSLLQHSLIRNAKFSKPIVIVGNEHRFIALEQAKEVGIEIDVIIEPEGKNTAPCALLASILCDNKDLIILLPSDHYINNLEEYYKSIDSACEAALKSSVSTLGIKPTYPHTGYGYIKLGQNISGESYFVENFVEKPDLQKAMEYFSSNTYLWNSGIFIFRPSEMINLAQEHTKSMFEHVKESLKYSEKDLDFIRLKAEAYSKIIPESIDYAIIEKASNIAVVKASFDWSDLGSFASIWEVSKKDENSNVLIGDIISKDSEKNYAYSPKKLTALVGVSNLIVINTEDATLVADSKSSEEIKHVVKALKNNNRDEVVNSVIYYRPWGSYQTIDLGELHKVKRIIVKPLHKLSLQYHHQRAEHWVVVKGVAEVQIGDDIHILKENDSIYIPKLAKHRLTNIGSEDLHIIEVQTGSYLGEDDIVRMADEYGRN